MACLCSIVPPRLLASIANSEVNPDHIRAEAQTSLDHRTQIAIVRNRLSAVASQPQAEGQPLEGRTAFVPQDLQQKAAEAAVHTDNQAENQPHPQIDIQIKGSSSRLLYNAGNTTTTSGLPGTLIRRDGQSDVTDSAVNQAFDNIGIVLQCYRDLFDWKSVDNQNGDLTASVHVGNNLQNAYWNGSQMLFGDGGKFIHSFTSCLDVIAHELTHAVTAHTTALVYEGQSGALNEHLSDVFGIMVKQKAANLTAEKSDWLLGEGCLLPGVQGVAVRSMKAPGTAYADPRFGSDEQVAHMSEFVYEPVDERHDFGGVHVNSGIPNKAFYLVATAFGGYSWEKAGQIWWKTIRSGLVTPTCTFEQFANVTIKIANEPIGTAAKDPVIDPAAPEMVRKAWVDVGVLRSPQ